MAFDAAGNFYNPYEPGHLNTITKRASVHSLLLN